MSLIEDNAHPWQEAYDDFTHRVKPILVREGKAIGDASRAGNAEATKIIDYYTMLYKSFDPMTFMLLSESLEKYQEKHD